MALIVENGTGLTNAESYLTVQEAADYTAKWYDDPDLGTVNDARIERALRRATRFVDSYDFFGWRAHKDQALGWPRAWVGWVDGQLIDTETVPDKIIQATAEAAIRDIKGDALFPDHEGGTIRREMKQVGDLRKETEFAGARTAGKKFEAIKALLKPYLQSGPNGGLVRGL